MNINLDMVLVIQSILYKGVSHQFDSKPYKTWGLITCTSMGSSVQIYSIIVFGQGYNRPKLRSVTKFGIHEFEISNSLTQIYIQRANVITCARFHLKQMWRLTKTIAEMKCEHWTKRWNWSWLWVRVELMAW